MGKRENDETLSRPERFVMDINNVMNGAVDVVAKYMTRQKHASYDKTKVTASLAQVKMALRNIGRISMYDHCTAAVAGAYAFSKTKQILRVDETLYTEIEHSVDETGEIPCDILMNLPYPAFFLEFPDKEDSTIGVFVHMDYGNYNEGKPCYSIWLNLNIFEGNEYATNDFGIILNIPLVEGKKLKEAVIEAYKKSDKEMGRVFEWDKLPESDEDAFTSGWMTIVNTLLYICSVNADIIPDETLLQQKTETLKTNQASSEPAKKTASVKNKNISNNPKKKAKVWDVGFRIGAELRKHQNTSSEAESIGSSGGKGGSKRTHMRRGHFHHYWVGSIKDNSRHLIVKWLPPIVIHAEYANTLPIVMHNVR